MKGFYGSRVLGLYKSIKTFENYEKIISTFHKINPNEMSKIINERDIICRTSFGGSKRRSPTHQNAQDQKEQEKKKNLY